MREPTEMQWLGFQRQASRFFSIHLLPFADDEGFEAEGGE
jgi:hypothetical protein